MENMALHEEEMEGKKSGIPPAPGKPLQSGFNAKAVLLGFDMCHVTS